MSLFDFNRLQNAYQIALKQLLSWRKPEGHWEGELSSSALSTAVAVSALVLTGSDKRNLMARGLDWLVKHQNADGGWGDTTISFSNISTTILCVSALKLAGEKQVHQDGLNRGVEWIKSRHGFSSTEISSALAARYGNDKTFSVPILTNAALAGLVEWEDVPSLPFELSCLPQGLYRFVGLPVVSYALPALISMGICIHRNNVRAFGPIRFFRTLLEKPSLRVLKSIQPSNGGFLEATPLTAFVCMSLAGAGYADHEVIKKGISFLETSVREDGSWPIDTNLATWVTTLSINAMAAGDDLAGLDKKEELKTWLLNQQYKTRHPYTGAEPGGWAWTNLPGGVPDADDTPGAMIALTNLGVPPGEWLAKAVRWLALLQNSDTGMPTFCHGWGKLPFDRSGADLTAHTLRAIAPFYGVEDQPIPESLEHLGVELESLFDGGFHYLANQQNTDGSWLPLWFGNQHEAEECNPVFGTARVLAAYRDCGMWADAHARKGLKFLEKSQNSDGGWGGFAGAPSTVEETAAVIDAIIQLDPNPKVLEKGLFWLIQRAENGQLDEVAPIGFYFAKLWYFERLYPLVFAVSALGRAKKLMGI